MSVPNKIKPGLFPTTDSLNLSLPFQIEKTGSATGNPRNKCALRPGHSLMDWIRLGNSGFDLSGTNGAIIPISTKELGKHCTKIDAWMAIRGNVYNITRYMDFHPGGPEELLRGAGKDATALFEEVHAWVNYEQLLKKCLIGPLQNMNRMDVDSFKLPKSNCPSTPQATVANIIPAKVIPRFHWIQKRSDLTLCFYTKQFCNPGLVVAKKYAKNIDVKICIANSWHHYDFDLQKDINWPPSMVKISSELGKIEINFAKIELNVWPSYGSKTVSNVQQLEDSCYEFEIIQKLNFNHNSIALLLRGKRDTFIHSPVGFHLTFSCNIEGVEVSRSYTPVPNKYSPINDRDCMNLHFLLKTYENGLLAKHVNSLQIKSKIVVSQPKGNLLLNKFLGHTKIALLAAGSGITPMLSLIDHLLARTTLRIEKLVLMFFNKTEEDIWCREILEKTSNNDNRLKITYILSQPKKQCCSEKGHISKELVSNITNPASDMNSTFICVCGPPAFNSLAEHILKALDFPAAAIHLFSG